MADQRSSIPGSAEHLRSGECWVQDADPDQPVTVTLLLRRPAGGPSEEDLLSGRYQAPSREQAEASLHADPADVKAATAFVNQWGMRVVLSDPASRRLRVEAPASVVDQAFGVHLKWAQDAQGHRFLTYDGTVSVPQPVAGVVTTVLGLSQRAVAQSR